jgi:hypothetical protein
VPEILEYLNLNHPVHLWELLGPSDLIGPENPNLSSLSFRWGGVFSESRKALS